MKTRLTMDAALRLARKHVDKGDMSSSARLALRDAVTLAAKGDFTRAKERALKSLSYSVGMFHADYKRVQKLIEPLRNNPIDPRFEGYRAATLGKPKSSCPYRSGDKKREWEKGYDAGARDSAAHFAYGRIYKNPRRFALKDNKQSKSRRKSARTKARNLHVNPKGVSYRIRAETYSGRTYYYNHAAGALDTRGEYATHFPASKLRAAMLALAKKLPSSIKFIEAVKV